MLSANYWLFFPGLDVVNEISLHFHSKLISPLYHIYASVNWVSTGSDNALSPIWCQAIILTNAGSLSIGLLGTKFSEILIKIQAFSFTKMDLKICSAKWPPFCPVRDELSSEWPCTLSALPEHVIDVDVIKWKHFPRYWPLCGEFTGHRWIPRTKASNAELWCFLWSALE